MSLRSAFLILCVMFVLVVTANAFYVLPRLSEQIAANDRTTLAVCALRADLERRVAASTRFLAEHPEGIPGIPARTIRDGLQNQQRTITALRGLKCPKPG